MVIGFYCISFNLMATEFIFAFVIGWGTIYFGGPTSSTLQEVINLNLLENQTKE